MMIFHHYVPFPGQNFLSILVNTAWRRQDHFHQCNKLSYERLGLSMLVFIEFYNYLIEFYDNIISFYIYVIEFYNYIRVGEHCHF